MKYSNIDRRNFLQGAFLTSLGLGVGVTPQFMSNAHAAPDSLQQRMSAFLNLEGGPDLRHLIVPEFSSGMGQDTFGYKYWKHRARAHQISQTDESEWLARWQNDYYPITVGGSGWNSGMVDAGNLNNGITFGIWREAGWLIDMFRAGNVALVFNAVGGTNRAHDLSSLMLNQGNVLSELNDRDRSGWGGRLARSAGTNMLSVTNSPSEYGFGPMGNAPNYNPNRIDNKDLLSVQNTREFGLYDFEFDSNQAYNTDDRIARAAKGYYAALRQEQVANVYEKIMDHEQKVREFGELIKDRLETIPVPIGIQALSSNGVNDANGSPINPDPITGDARKILRSSYSFGRQIANFADAIYLNQTLGARVVSLQYGGWDSHGNQRRIPGVLATDPNNPNESRGIESGLKDIFGGQFGNSPSDPNALHGGFSAVWDTLPSQSERSNLVVNIAGEFGRQIRDNGDSGTDHGKGNLMFVISESCNGGVYGEIFPEIEVDKYDDESLNTPDIEPRTEIDHIFASVSDWVAPGSAASVFPRTASGYSGEAPLIEVPNMFNSLFS